MVGKLLKFDIHLNKMWIRYSITSSQVPYNSMVSTKDVLYLYLGQTNGHALKGMIKIAKVRNAGKKFFL